MIIGVQLHAGFPAGAGEPADHVRLRRRQAVRGKRLAAVELLMSYPDTVVAEMLGVRLQTVVRWMQDEDLAETLRSREREQARSLARLARQAAVRAAAALCQAAGNGSKPDPKVMLDILKASGAFEAEQADPAEALRDIIKFAGQAAEVTDEPQEQ
jgi:hypothetical protein